MAHRGRYEGESFKDWWKRRQRENRMNWQPGFQDYGRAGADLGSVVSRLTGGGAPDMETNEYTVLPGETVAQAQARIFGTDKKQKKKTVITRIDDASVPDKEVTTIEDVDDEIRERIEPDGKINVEGDPYPSVDAARQGTAAEFGGVRSPPWSIPARFGSQRWREGAADATPGGLGVFGPSDLERQAIAEVNPESRWAAESLVDVPGTQPGAVDEVLPHLSDPDVLRRIQDWRRQNGSITADQIERIRTDIYNEREAAAAQGQQDGLLGRPDVDETIPIEATPIGEIPAEDTTTTPDGDSSTPNDDTSSVGGSTEIDPVTTAELERQWGKWTYKPKERRDKFMKQLNNIYMKGAMLDAIAAFSGGQSRSAEYIERAIGKLDAITKFDQEERIYNIWHDVYYNREGVYDPPKSKKEASDRARQLGASPAETKAIYGWAEEGEDLQQWWRLADNEKGFEVAQTTGKREAPEQGKGEQWQQGSVPTTLSAPTSKNRVYWTNGPDEVLLVEGETPEDLLYPGTWERGRKDASATANVRVGSIDFIENVYLNSINAGHDEEAARVAAANAAFLQYKNDPELYIFMHDFDDPVRKESARKEIDNIIDSFNARGQSFKAHGQPGAPALPPETAKVYNSEEEAEAAVAAGTLRVGDRVIINGQPGTWE